MVYPAQSNHREYSRTDAASRTCIVGLEASLGPLNVEGLFIDGGERYRGGEFLHGLRTSFELPFVQIVNAKWNIKSTTPFRVDVMFYCEGFYCTLCCLHLHNAIYSLSYIRSMPQFRVLAWMFPDYCGFSKKCLMAPYVSPPSYPSRSP